MSEGAALLKMPRAMVLAAGLGTRLAPLTDELPKPLVWLGDRPLLDAILAGLSGAGFREVVVNTHHLPDAFDEGWRATQPVDVKLVHEPKILGTGGGVANASKLLGAGPVLVWNADISATFDVGRLIATHESAASLATFVTGPRLAPRAGTLGLDPSGRIVRVRAFDGGGEVASADYAGIALLSEALRERLPRDGCLVGDALIPALERGERVDTFALEDRFHDLGTPELYLEANLAWLARRGLRAFVHPSASVARGIELVGAIVAAGARVEGEGKVESTVVWPQATALAPLSNAVVTPRRIVTLRR